LVEDGVSVTAGAFSLLIFYKNITTVTKSVKKPWAEDAKLKRKRRNFYKLLFVI
jgi:hypothetical protein